MEKNILLILLAVLCFAGTVKAHETTVKSGGAASKYIVNYYTNPLVHVVGKETFTFSIKVKDKSIKSMMVPYKPSPYKRNGVRLDTVKFYNDGTHGDAVAGDSMFTLDGLTMNSYDSSPVSYHFFLSREVIYEFNSGERKSVEEYIEFLVLWLRDDLVKIPDAVTYGDSIRATDYVVSVKQNYRGEFPDLNKDDVLLATAFYKYFEDDIDFFLLPIVFNTSRLGGSHTTISNSTQGTGASVYDNSKKFGSMGRLKGLINIFHHFDKLSVINHEILHQWGVFTNEKLFLNKSGDTHWGLIEMESSGFGTADVVREIVKLTDSTYYTTKDSPLSQKCSNLELYLMGYIPIDSVKFPLRSLKNPVYLGKYEGKDLYKSEGIKLTTKEEFISVQGKRIPDHLNSQKNYNVAVIIPYERLLSTTEIAYFDFITREIENENSRLKSGISFYQATRGLGKLRTRLLLNEILSVQEETLPQNYRLYQNMPNPFNPATIINYQIPEQGHVTLKVYDVLGREVVTLIDEYMNPGSYNIEFNARHIERSREMASGIYFYRLSTPKNSITKKMMLLK